MASRIRRFSSALTASVVGAATFSPTLFTSPTTDTLEKTPRFFFAKDLFEGCTLISTTLDPKHHLTCERMRERFDNTVLFSGSSNPELAEETAWELGKELGKATVGRYADGEVEVKLETSVRGKDVYILQSASPPINETLLESLLIVSAARRASARSVTLVAPSLPYQRSTGSNLSSHMEEGGGVFLDARHPPTEGAEEENSRSLPSATLQALLRAAHTTRAGGGDGSGGGTGSGSDAELRAMALSASAAATASKILSQLATHSVSSSTRGQVVAVDSKSLSSADVARMLVASGVDRVIGVELGPPGMGQSEGFYPSSVPVESLRATRISANHLAKLKLNKPVVVSPNEETITLAVDMRSILQAALPGSEVGLACITEVASHGKVKLQLIGDVRGRDVILSDHIIDSGKSLCERVTLLKQAGCERVVASATHGIFSGKALQRISRSPLSDVVVTNTVPLREGVDTRDLHKLSQISVAPLLASAIIRSQLDISLQPLKSARVVVADASEHK